MLLKYILLLCLIKTHLGAKILCTCYSLRKCRVGAEPREWWRAHTQPECAGYTDSIHSTAPPTEQTEKMTKWVMTYTNLKHCIAEISLITFFFWSTVSALWKQTEREKIIPTNRLFSEKTSATSDHCHTSLDTAKLPPASTAPGPGPAILREGAHSHCTQTTFSLGLPLSFCFIAANKQSYTSLIPKLVWITVWLLHYMTVMEWGYFGATVVRIKRNRPSIPLENTKVRPQRKYTLPQKHALLLHECLVHTYSTWVYMQ